MLNIGLTSLGPVSALIIFDLLPGDIKIVKSDIFAVVDPAHHKKESLDPEQKFDVFKKNDMLL